VKKNWTIKAAGRGSLEILLYEEIGENFFGEGTTAKSFAEDLAAAGPGITDIHLRVNSPGGNVFDGIAIYNTLLSHGAAITAAVEGLAASIASVIIMAAAEITMAPSALLMIHNPYAAVLGGDAADMRKMADTLDKVKESMIGAYRRHAKGVSKVELSAMMDAETWLSANEARDEGFVEDITDPDEPDQGLGLAANFDVSRFRNMPAQIAAKLQARSSAAQPSAEGERERQRMRVELLKRL